MGFGFSSPCHEHPRENHLGDHFRNNSATQQNNNDQNNNFPTPSYCGFVENNVPASTVKFISCPLCCKLCENQGDLCNHLSVVHSPKVCPACNFIAQGLASFADHVEKEHHSLKVCQICGSAIKIEYFDVHFDMHSTDTLKSFRCTICSKAFKTEDKCKNHEKKHESTFYKCCHCEHSSVSKYEDKKHRAQHLTERHREFLCNICYDYFEKGETLLGHMRIKHYMNSNKVPNAVSCLICFNEFTNGESLVKHVKSFHERSSVVEKSAVDSGSGDLKHKCPYCTMFIKNPKVLATHIIVFHEEAPFTCKCSKKFFSKGQLDLHILVHTKFEEEKFKLHSNRGRKRKL